MNKSAIALIGPSGTGKSSIGKLIAERLRWNFIDCDREIERRSGKSIAEIFREAGEPEFRKQESCYLQELYSNKLEQLVISTGGGMPIFADNFSLLESMSVLVYLCAPVEVLVTRIKFGEERPLLSSAGSTTVHPDALVEAKSRLEKLIAERESIYNRARYKIDTSRANAEQLADDIIKLVGVI